MAFLVATTSLPAVYRPNGYARTTAGTPHARANIENLWTIGDIGDLFCIAHADLDIILSFLAAWLSCQKISAQNVHLTEYLTEIQRDYWKIG